jgi:hypothetical protein
LGGERQLVNEAIPEKPDSPFADRRYYSVDASSASEVAAAIPASERHFVLFLAWDASRETDESVRKLARSLFAKGLAYLVAWGPDCSRVHDLFDFVGIDEGWDLTPESVVMTTWHDDEALASALWFFLFNTIPDEAYEATCQAGLAVAIDNSEWAAKIRHYLRNPAELDDDAGV